MLRRLLEVVIVVQLVLKFTFFVEHKGSLPRYWAIR